MTKFCIATNFDLTLLAEIERLNKKYSLSRVTEIYGSLPFDLAGSGRGPVGLPNISAQTLENHIKHAHNIGLKFNYLMNAPKLKSLGDTEWKKGIYQFIKYLKKIDIDSITISDESFIKYIRKEFEDIPINVSLITGVDTPKEAKKFSDLGVDLIILNQHTINRDIKKIKEIIDSVNCKIRLYANISCLQDCQMRNKHYDWLGSQSITPATSSTKQIDRFILWCEDKYIKNPIELLRSPFIRPEGLKLYQKIGVDSFKLSDRRDSTSTLVELLEAYMNEKYHGNLFSLLFRNDKKWTNAIRSIIDEKFLGNTSISIDNDKLTELNFDIKVTSLSGDKLKNFYELATHKTVSGILDQKTKEFHTKLHSVK